MEDMTVVFFYMLDAPCSVHKARFRLGDGSLQAVCVIVPEKPREEVTGHRERITKKKGIWKYRRNREKDDKGRGEQGREEQSREEQSTDGRSGIGSGRGKQEGEWTGALLQKYLDRLPIPRESRHVYFVPDKRMEQLLGRSREPLNLEWIYFFIEYYALSFDSLVLLQDREMAAEELVRCFARDVPYLAVVESEEGASGIDWAEVQEDLEVEYGLTLDVQQELAGTSVRGKRPLFILGKDVQMSWLGENEPVAERGRSGKQLPDRTLFPGGSIVISTAGRRREGLAEYFSKKKVRYVDMEGFLRDTVLDTVHKIRYNSTR